jgi:Resolvase, N terminal domain
VTLRSAFRLSAGGVRLVTGGETAGTSFHGGEVVPKILEALTAAGVNPTRVYTDKLSGTSTREQRPGLAALLDYARPGDAIVVVGIDRLGRNAAEVMTTIRELRDRDIVLKSLREGIDTSNATGRMVAGVLASWPSWNWNLVGNAALLHGRRGGHAVRRSGGRRPLTSQRPNWRGGCTPAGSQ